MTNPPSRLLRWFRKTIGIPHPADMLGLRPDNFDARDYVKRVKTGTPPDSFTLSGVLPELEPYQQGSTQACSGYAGAMFVRLLYGQHFSKARAGWLPSPLFLYYNARRLDDTVATDTGAQLRNLFKGMQQFGVAPESFHSETLKVTDAPSVEATRMARLLTIHSYERIFVNANTPDNMVSTLSLERLPILIGAQMPASVATAPTTEDGLLRWEETILGGHALVVDGYDSSEHCFMGWNSWGAGWGRGGRFRIPFDWFTRSERVYDIWTCTPNYWW